MSKPLTYRKPSGEWGIEGVEVLPEQMTIRGKDETIV